MKYIIKNNNDPIDFPFWSGAISTIESIRRAGKEAEFNNYMNELLMWGKPLDSEGNPGLWTDTEINDEVWHNSEEIYKACGLDENGEPLDALTLKVDGRPMTEDEAEQLKDAIFSGGDEELLNAAKEAADEDEDAFDMENYEYSYQIPNHVINAVYGEISFTAEDFACNV